MNSYFIEHNKTKQTVNIMITTSNGESTETGELPKKCIVKENYSTGRVYIIDAQDEQKEYLSIPLANCVIKTKY